MKTIVSARALVFLLSALVLSSCAQTSESETPTVLKPSAIPIAWRAVHAETGQEIGERSSSSMLPASTTKLVTALAVLDTVPPDLIFTTRVCRNGDAVALIGGGDPAFDVEDLLGLALTAKDAMAGATALTYAPAEVSGPIQPKQPGDAAYNPRLADLMVAEGAYRGHGSEDGHGWTVPPGASVPSETGTDWYAHPDPPRQAADLFRAYAAGMGVDLPAPEPGEARCDAEIARHESAPVFDLVREMLWTSSNPMAELLGRMALQAEAPGAWLASRHPDIDGFALTNFSGLDAEARLTPRAMARLLAANADLAVAGVPFPAMLTPAGWDGGLKRRMLEPPLALNVWAKTGTMHYGAGLAGYMLVPGKGMFAIAVYAFDEEARAAYDAVVRNPPEEVEVAARNWRMLARAEIDRTVLKIYRALSAE
ncbi:D-alanyl-D-alanine carboxypeptidase [Hwanghaeella grinnelliae]|uniref:D-alanyl-D-alanine carboxypeptidase n=1 Tax=Hwanghaeella grinnelliae TaxID=2500179 RepID=UPI0019605E07|nr:D-alanyl-D-alanine carboxypeptidase [Hwanghaeella grinnelliae]